MTDTPLLAALRQSADPKAVDRIEHLVEHGADRDLNRINALAFAANHNPRSTKRRLLRFSMQPSSEIGRPRPVSLAPSAPPVR